MIGRPQPDEIPVDAKCSPSSDRPSHPVAPPGHAHGPALSTLTATPRSRSSRMLWAQFLARIYEVLPLLCPACGGEMRIISFITLPSTVQDILLHLDLPLRPPRVSPAWGPPQAELHFDQSPTFELAAPEAIPELPSLRSGEPAGYLLRSSSRGSARTGSSSISRLPMTGMPEARTRPRPPLPPDPGTRPPHTAHPNILPAPIPMAPRPPRLRLPPGASRACSHPRHHPLSGRLLGQTPRTTLPPPRRGPLDRLLWGKLSRHTSATRRPISF